MSIPRTSSGGPGVVDSQQGILAVVVLYKMSFAESATVQTLLEAVRILGESPARLAILVFDNTPGGQDPGPLPAGISYAQAPANPGLAGAYNSALGSAVQEGFDWLLTLDQDTKLPSNFLTKMFSYAKRYAGVAKVAAIVPRISDNGRPISPFRFVGGFFPRVLPPDTEGISRRFTSALNSASLLRVRALRQLGGYDTRFPVHNSDTSLYHRLDLAGARVVVIPDLLVDHELAILHRKNGIAPERYRKMLADECIFWDLHMGVLGRVERLVRLAGRVCKGYLQNESGVFRNIAIAEIRRRLFTSRRDRLREST